MILGDEIMEGRIGLIGGGNMAAAIISGILKAGISVPERILAADVSEAAREKLKDTYGIMTTSDNQEAARFSEILFLAVKPHICGNVIPEIRDVLDSRTVVVSIAAGQTLEKLDSWFGKEVPIVRAMPNTPAMVGEGMTAFCCSRAVTEQQKEQVAKILNSFGKAEPLPEPLFNTVTAVSGSSPAYVYMFIEAMADGAVAGGMDRQTAYRFCAQAVLGSAKMVLDTGRHPGELKDMVCSPGGTTMEAVLALEEKGMRAAVESAVRACIRKAEEL